MISEPHIYRAADLLIRRYGADATTQATRLIDLMLERGDLDGQRVWLRIKAAILVLQAPTIGTVH